MSSTIRSERLGVGRPSTVCPMMTPWSDDPYDRPPADGGLGPLASLLSRVPCCVFNRMSNVTVGIVHNIFQDRASPSIYLDSLMS